MAIPQDVNFYGGSARNVCSDSIVQFQYEAKKSTTKMNYFFPVGEPIGALAATVVSNLAYKAALDSPPCSNFSWKLIKEVLLCKANCRNDIVIILTSSV